MNATLTPSVKLELTRREAYLLSILVNRSGFCDSVKLINTRLKVAPDVVLVDPELQRETNTDEIIKLFGDFVKTINTVI